MTKDKNMLINYIVTILIGLGAATAGVTFNDVFENELKDYYVCDMDSLIMEFAGGVSSTSYTGYPYADSRKGYKRCGTTENKGQWIDIKEYASNLGIDPYELIEQPNNINPIPTEGKKWLCSLEGCVVLNKGGI